MHPLFAPLEQIFPPNLLQRVLLVGGCVRDHLAGREARDLDLAGELSPQELRALGFRPIAPVSSRPVHFLHRPGLGVVEFTVISGDDGLRQDLQRRDFTINAMAMDSEGRILDPLGGQTDLEQKLLSPCSSGCFTDDPARIFRGLRFETDGWRLTEEALELISSRSWEEELARLPVERFSGEMMRALAGNEPERFFRRMVEQQVGIGILPELFAMASIPAGPLAHHPEGDLLIHSLQTLEALASLDDSPVSRFCSLFHDLGKLATPADEHPRHIGHERSGAVMALPFCRRLRLPASWGRALAASCRLHLTAGRWKELRPGTRLTMAEKALKGGIERLLPLLVLADRGEPMPTEEWAHALEAAQATPEELGLDPGFLSGPNALPPEQRAERVRQARIGRLKE